jgi:hypothetical protein
MQNLNEYIVCVMKNIFQKKKNDVFDFDDVLDICSIPQLKFI